MKLQEFLNKNGLGKVYSKLINGSFYIESLDQLRKYITQLHNSKTVVISSTSEDQLNEEEVNTLTRILLN